ncbi:MAG: DNA polymerase III subunit delta' [Pseudomonadota bacterium]
MAADEDLPSGGQRLDFPHPRTQTSLVGQSEAWSALEASYQSGRMHHGWLLTGVAGIGKATLAYRFAEAILSHSRFSDNAPNFGDIDQKTQSLVTQNAHPDLKAIERRFDTKTKRLRSEITVDDIRQLGQFFASKPAFGAWRVGIIDAAEEMNRNAANALLKLLEEPPQRAVIFLVSHVAGRLLPTLKSRVRRLPMTPLDADSVRSVVARCLTGEKTRDGAIDSAISVAGGSAGEALEILVQDEKGALSKLASLLSDIDQGPDTRLHDAIEAMLRKRDDAIFWRGISLIRDSYADRMRSAALLPAPIPVMQAWSDAWQTLHSHVEDTRTLNLDRKYLMYLSLSRLKDLTIRSKSQAA